MMQNQVIMQGIIIGDLLYSAEGFSNIVFTVLVDCCKTGKNYIDCIAFGPLADSIMEQCEAGIEINLIGHILGAAKYGERILTQMVCVDYAFLGSNYDEIYIDAYIDADEEPLDY